MACHSKIGASSMYRWANCPASVKLSEHMPSSESSYALEGTRAHELASYYLLNDKWPNDLHMQDNAEMIEAVQVYVDSVYQDRRALDSTYNGNLFLVEHGFSLKEIDPEAYGTADCVIYDAKKKHLIVYDFKYGAGISVEVTNNEQLMYYALGAILSLPQIRVSKVILKIVQPRCPHPEGMIREWAFSSIETLDFYAEVELAIKKTKDPNAPINPGKWCRFCPAAPVCPKLTENALTFAKEIFTPVPDKYDPKKLSEMLDKLEVIEDHAKKVREFAYAEAIRGRCPPGYKLVEKRATRKWRPELLIEQILEKMGVDSLEMYETPKLKSPAQIEKLIKKEDKEKLKEIVVAESSGFKLVHEAEPGEPIKLGAKDLFTEVT